MFAFLKKPQKKAARPSLPAPGRTVDVGGQSVPLVVRENIRATRITLRIEPGGRALRMTVPRGLHHRDVDDFLKRHHGWLLERMARYGDTGLLQSGGSVEIRGVRHRIEHTGSLRGLTETMVRDGSAILWVSGPEENIAKRVATYLRKEARKDLEALVHTHAAAIGKPVKSITLKDTRSRWGSCSWQGNLSFSWRIVMAPPEVIDYLAAHEVAHLQEMNHGPQFWALCKRLCPQTDEARAWLKQNGSRLQAVDFG